MIRAPTEQITYSIDLNIFYSSTLHLPEREREKHNTWNMQKRTCSIATVAVAAESTAVEANQQQWFAVNFHDTKFTTSM